jgi:hypothetical protein
MNPVRYAAIAWAAAVATQLACSAGNGPAHPPTSLPVGSWGGDSAGMTVTDSAMHLQIACTYGDVAGPVPVASDGSFSVSGSYMPRAYPVAMLPPVPAQFHGVIDGTAVTVTVLVNDTVMHQSVTH